MTGPAVVVVGACGGCGASLVAGGIALAWAAAGAATWLVEIDVERGDLAGAWGVSAERGMADLVSVSAELDAGHLRQAGHAHSSGAMLVLGPGTPGAGALWDAAAVMRLVEVAGGEGRVVLDAGAGLSSLAIAAAEAATRVLLVCPPRVAAARRARRLVEALAGTGADRRSGLVVSGVPGGSELSAGALARAVGVEVVAETPWDEGDARQIGVGRWPGGRRRGLGAGLSRLAEAIA
jgi:Flp pilus assembly CpaE family ATPase